MTRSTVISPTCEVWITAGQKCGAPTVGGYAAMGGGWMALCVAHIEKHESYSFPIEDIRSGLADCMMNNGSRG